MRFSCKFVKPAFFVLLAVALLFGAVGCSPAVENDGKLPPGYVPQISGRLTVSCRSDVYPSEASQAGVRSWISAFESKYSDVDVTAEFNIPDMAPLIASKSIGDVYWLDDGSVYDYAITQKALMPLDHYVEALQINLDDVYTGIKELGVVNGELYFAGMSCGQQSFTYSLDAMYAAGILQAGEKVANDWTWEDFKAYAEMLTVPREDGTYEQLAMSMPLSWAPYFSPFFVAYGGKWVDTTNKKVSFTSDPLVVKGVEEMINAIDKNWIYPSGVALGSARATAYQGINDTQGIVFSYIQAYTVLPQRGALYDSQNVNWDCAPFPLFEYSASPCGTIGFGVFNYTKNADAAAALVLSLYTEEGQMAIHGQTGGDVPLLKALGEDDFWHLKQAGWEDKNYGAFTANYERYIPGHVRNQVPSEIATLIEDGMKDLLNSYCSSGASWQDKLREMEERCNQLWDSMI